MRKEVYESLTEASVAAGVSQPALSKWISNGRLKAERIPGPGKGRYRIRDVDLVEACRGTAYEFEKETRQMLLGSDDVAPLALEVVWPEEKRAARFTLKDLQGFTSLRAVTFTPSLDAILRLLGVLGDLDTSYENMEVVFGSERLTKETDAAKVVLLQKAIADSLTQRYLAVGGITDPRTARLAEMQAQGRVSFYAAAGGVVHSKLYLLERDGLRRAMVGSANLSVRAFSGRQGEVLMSYDNNDFIWDLLSRKYEAIKTLAVTTMLDDELRPAHLVKAEELPAHQQMENGARPQATIYVYQSNDDVDLEDLIAVRAEELEQVAGDSLREYIKPVRLGEAQVHYANIVKVNRAIAPRLPTAPEMTHRLEYMGGRFAMDGQIIPRTLDSLDGDAQQIKNYFGTLEEFGRDADRLQVNYFALMGWQFFTPFMPRLARALWSEGIDPSKRTHNLAVIYGQSNCGKSAIVRFLHRAMFGPPVEHDNSEFTMSKFKGFAERSGLLPIVYQDIESVRFMGRNAQAEVIVKAYDQLTARGAYPCTIVTSNAEYVEFTNQFRTRALLVYAPRGIAADDDELRHRLDQKIRPFINRITTGFYSEYLYRMDERLTAALESAPPEEFDYLHESTLMISRMLTEDRMEGEYRPEWAKPIKGQDYGQAAWELKYAQATRRFSSDRYTPNPLPEPDRWTATATEIIVGVESVRDLRESREFPAHWIKQDSNYSTGRQFHLDRREVEASLARAGQEWELPIPDQSSIFTRLRKAMQR